MAERTARKGQNAGAKRPNPTKAKADHDASSSEDDQFAGQAVMRTVCAESAEKQFCPSAVCSKSNHAADPLCEHLLALVRSVVEEDEVLGVEFAGEEVSEVADLHQNLTQCADDKAGSSFLCRPWRHLRTLLIVSYHSTNLAP